MNIGTVRGTELTICAVFVIGLKSSVTQFNRFPEVTAAVARRFGVPIAHYVDDFQVIDVAATKTSGQDIVFEIHCQVGDGIAAGQPRPFISAPAVELAKRKPRAPSNIWLGVMVDLSVAHSEGTVTFKPTARRIEHILNMWATAKRSNKMTTWEARGEMYAQRSELHTPRRTPLASQVPNIPK